MAQQGPASISGSRTVAAALAGGAFVGSGRESVAVLVDLGPWQWGELLLHGAVWALGMGVFLAVLRAVRRRDTDQERGRLLVLDALDTGDLPENLNPVAWRRALTEEIRQDQQSRWVWGVLALLIAALVAAAAVVDRDPGVGLLAAALAGFVVVPVRWLTRRMERAQELLARIDAA